MPTDKLSHRNLIFQSQSYCMWKQSLSTSTYIRPPSWFCQPWAQVIRSAQKLSDKENNKWRNKLKILTISVDSSFSSFISRCAMEFHIMLVKFVSNWKAGYRKGSTLRAHNISMTGGLIHIKSELLVTKFLSGVNVHETGCIQTTEILTLSWETRKISLGRDLWGRLVWQPDGTPKRPC